MLAYIWTIHGAVLSASLAVLYKYSEQSSVMKNVTEIGQDTSKKMRFEIADDLRARLRPVFCPNQPERKERIAEKVIDFRNFFFDSNDPFEVTARSPEGTRAYKDALLDFVSEKKSALAQFCALRQAIKGWKIWNCVRSWTAFSSAIWELIAISLVGASHKLDAFDLSREILVATLVPTVFLVIVFILSMAISMYYHDRLMRISSSDE